MYKHALSSDCVIRVDDGACIPADPGNSDYEAVIIWLLLGNALAPAEPIRTQPLDRVLELREQHIAGGFAYGGYRWDSDDRSRANLSATVTLISAGVPLPQGFVWRSEDNQNVPLSIPELVGLGAAMLQHVNGCYVRSWQLKAELAGAQDPFSVDLEGGWDV